jgi:hypothetical protein
MARGSDFKRDDEEEKENKDVGVSDDALDLVDEDEEDDPLIAQEPEDDKGWE